jgi:hypothetical protein
MAALIIVGKFLKIPIWVSWANIQRIARAIVPNSGRLSPDSQSRYRTAHGAVGQNTSRSLYRTCQELTTQCF